MKFIKVSALALLSCGFLLAATPAADDDEYQAKLRDENAKAAKAHGKWGGWLEGKKMYAMAKAEYLRAVTYDRHYEKAQTKLGNQYNAGKDQWEFSPELAMKQKVLQKQDEKVGEDRKKIITELVKKKERDGKGVAKGFSSLGKWCQKNGKEKEGKLAFQKALEYDPGNKGAREDLGYQRQKEGGWVSQEMAELRKELAEGVAKAPKGAASSEKSSLEEAMGFSHSKLKTNHIQIESAAIGSAEMQLLVQHGEHVYAMFQKIFGQGEMFNEPYDFAILKDVSEFHAYIDKTHQGSAEHKKFSKKNRGYGGFPRMITYHKGRDKQEGDLTQPSLQDMTMHYTIQACAGKLAGGNRLWIVEGTAYWFTENVQKSAVWSCVDLSGTGSGSSEPDLRDPNNWRIQMKVMVRDGEELDINEVIKCRKFSEFSSREVVKAWSLVDFLISEHREKFIALCEALRANQKDPGEESLQKAFGWTPAQLDDYWKQYVRANY